MDAVLGGPVFDGRSISVAHQLRQLGAGGDAELGKRVVDVGLHCVRGEVQLLATERLVAPSAMRLMTVSSESVRLSQPVFARGWVTMRRSTPNRRSARPTRRASASASHSTKVSNALLRLSIASASRPARASSPAASSAAPA